MATFSAYLRSRSDDELVALLLERPDLASPSPSTVSSLAARATSRASIERALAGIDALVLQVVEAVVALDDGTTIITADDVAHAVGATGAVRADPDDGQTRALLDAAVERATALALIRPAGAGDPPAKASRAAASARTALVPTPGLAEVLGPYPAGLAPAVRAHPIMSGTAEPGPVTLTADQQRALADAPPGARQVLDALAWGPPVGVMPAPRTPARDAVQWLLTHALLTPGDARHVLLPRAVALALRSGRTHRALAMPPAPQSGGDAYPPGLVTAESSSAAERIVRLVATVVRVWEIEPAPVLRTGGLGVRELRRLAVQLEVPETDAAFVVEMAGAAELVVDDGEENPSFAPTLAVDEWLAADLPTRWSLLARTWLLTTRTPWLVGSRDERDAVRAALDPELSRPWAPRLRRSVLDVLADTLPGVALTSDDVTEQLTWRTPRAVPPQAAVIATLREASLLGIVAAGALSAAGRALLAESAEVLDVPPSPARGGRAPAGPLSAADELRAGLGPAVDEILLQGDLTGVVPGRPTPDLEALIERSARVESRGGALTVRFTPESIRAALDAGTTADELLGALEAHARDAVPQPLEYLVRDAARRHGRLRAGAASSYVRAEDPALLAGLIDDPRLASLGLVRLAPTVLASQVPTRELLTALRERALAPVAEGPDGQLVYAERVVRRTRGRVRRSGLAAAADVATHPTAQRAARIAALVPELRRAEALQAADRAASAQVLAARGAVPRTVRTSSGAATRPGATSSGATRSDAGLGNAAAPDSAHGARPATSGAGEVPAVGGLVPDAPAAHRAAELLEGTADPATALGLLREAVADRTEVWLELVDPRGVTQRRLVRPLRVDGGRLRALDPARDAELTVAVHRIASVSRVEPVEPEPPRGDA